MAISKLYPQALIILFSFLFINNAVLADTASEAKNDQEIVELQPKDFKPAFTQETVLKLNAIVHRSFEVIGEYDDTIKNTRTTVDQAIQEGASDESKSIAQKNIDKLGVLCKRSRAALADMTKAATELRNSDEVYNPVILHGMIDFVEDVEREVSAEHAKLSGLLSKQ